MASLLVMTLIYAVFFLFFALVLMTAVPGSAPHENSFIVASSSALKLLKAHDAVSAIKIMEKATSLEPWSGHSWRVLGSAYREAGQFDKAIDAHRKSLEVEPQFLSTIYDVGVLHALKGDPDRAFEWLFKAKATHVVDMSGIAQDEDLAGLRKDARFGLLLAKREDLRKSIAKDGTKKQRTIGLVGLPRYSKG